MQLLKIDKVGKYSGMVHGGHNIQVVVVQDQPLNIVDLVKTFALDLLNLVVGKVHHLQTGVILPHAKQVPGQSPELVAVENEDLRLGWDVLQDARVSEACVGAVGDPHLPVRVPGLVPGWATVTPA